MNDLFDLIYAKDSQTHIITAENVYGEKGKACMAQYSPIPQPEVEKIGQPWNLYNDFCPARELGEGHKVRPSIPLYPHSVTTLMDVDGPGSITHIWLTTSNERYSSLILRFYWDDETTPSVEVPVGDFFCTGWRMRSNVLALPVNVNPIGGNNMFFKMPFRKHARITIENTSDSTSPNFFYAISFETCEVPDDALYFHAQFRRENKTQYLRDYTILDNVKGKGHYVGTFMNWQQFSPGWWGEGEFKGYIDGDTDYPTYCSTGTEDYFGGAWCFKGDYSAPFMGYKDFDATEENVRHGVGHRHSMYRFHITDPIRFKSDLKIVLQPLGWKSEHRFLPLQDDISSVAYWYQTEPHTAFPELPDLSDWMFIQKPKKD